MDTYYIKQNDQNWQRFTVLLVCFITPAITDVMLKGYVPVLSSINVDSCAWFQRWGYGYLQYEGHVNRLNIAQVREVSKASVENPPEQHSGINS